LLGKHTDYFDMKVNRIFVAVENKSGSCYQIALTDSEQNAVIDLIQQMHKGTVKAVRGKLPFTLGERPNK